MHQPDQQRAPAKTVFVGVRGAQMRRGLAGMAMRVNMHGAVAMTVFVEMHAVAP